MVKKVSPTLSRAVLARQLAEVEAKIEEVEKRAAPEREKVQALQVAANLKAAELVLKRAYLAKLEQPLFDLLNEASRLTLELGGRTD